MRLHLLWEEADVRLLGECVFTKSTKGNDVDCDLIVLGVLGGVI